MHNFEKLGAFYLGKRYDDTSASITDDLLLYDAKDLTTHAVCVGMTGSGKTGLCIGLLEEAAIDGVPALIIDPKGDLANRLLTFDTLSPKRFQPYVNPDTARQKSMTVEEFAAAQASLWKSGLADWHQDEARIRRLNDAANVHLYTPGSSVGLPLSVLRSFAAPAAAVCDDPDLFRETVSSTVTGLLALVDIEADPVTSREHILLATLLGNEWMAGHDVSLEEIIRGVQNPPFSRVGVFELESFFPADDRLKLAMRLNAIIAAPGFQRWATGAPLDIAQLLYGPGGKPNHVIFSIAHLNDAERMFFVTLLLNRVVGWMRTQSGTSTLRALLYIDEIFGYMPPVANPPSKQPLLTLLKQARAFGVGVMVATQNPADLDYKGLSNAGTWFIGRLQTKRDRERMLDGLAGAGASQGGRFDRARMSKLIGGLGKRVFLMNNVHEDTPVLFHTRWVMSYLAGPLSREQLAQLAKKGRPAIAPAVAAAPATPPRARTSGRYGPRPILGKRIPQAFLPPSDDLFDYDDLVYEPAILAIGTVHFSSPRHDVLQSEPIALLAEWSDRATARWKNAALVNVADSDLESEPIAEDARFGTLTRVATDSKTYTQMKRTLTDWLYRNRTVQLWQASELKLTSSVGESQDAFRVRVRLAAHEARDQAIDKLRARYATRLRTAEDRLVQAQQRVEREREEATGSRIDTAVSIGTAILGSLLGRKTTSRSTISRVGQTISRGGRTLKQSKDVARARETVERREQQLHDLRIRVEQEIESIGDTYAIAAEELQAVSVRPKKKDIVIHFFGLVWQPRSQP